MNRKSQQFVHSLESICLFIIGIFCFTLPVLFLSTTTDAFVLPKQIVLSVAVTFFALFFGIKTIVEGRLRLRTSPFNIPVALFILVTFLSAIFSVNRFDALTAFVPLFFTAFLYFAIVNIVRGQKQLLFVLSCLIFGAVVSSVLAIFSFFKIYLLPFPYTHVPFFTTFGSLLDQALYLALILPITGYFAYSFFTTLKKRRGETFANEEKSVNKSNGKTFFFSISFLLILIALAVTLYQLLTTQKPLILPFSIGLQTAFAAISQDPSNVLKSFLLGSGVGTYLVDFTRFKPALYNMNETLWSFTFFRSSSYILELLATTGILGVLSFFYIIVKIVKEDRTFFPILLAVLAALFLPFSFTLVVLFFILLGIFAVTRILSNPQKYTEVDMYLVALKKGFVVAVPEGEKLPQHSAEKRYSKILPIVFFLFLILIISVPMYYSVRFFASDFIFQRSLVAASQNNGLETYNLQTAAINMFPYRDVYYRSFAQTNLALANALATNTQNGEKPNEQTQQNIVLLIQQAISAARGATTVSPLTTFNWNSLSSVYRSLIGFGQNADQFSVVTLQQAIALDPNNPQQYVELGGVYYQLGQYDEAIRQFQIAINLKNDYPNAYYNLGHALEEKGDFQNAMRAYQIVKSLVAENPENVAKINEDIKTLETKAENQQAQGGGQQAPANAVQSDEPLNVNEPATSLPERDPQVKIPAPTVTVAPTAAANKNNTNKVTPTVAPQR